MKQTLFLKPVFFKLDIICFIDFYTFWGNKGDETLIDRGTEIWARYENVKTQGRKEEGGRDEYRRWEEEQKDIERGI